MADRYYDWREAPSIVTPAGGVVTGYSDDPLYSYAGATPKTDRAISPYLLAPSISTPGGGKVTGYAGDPFYSQAGATAPKTNRDGTGNPLLSQSRANPVAQALYMGGDNGRATGGG